MKQHLRHGSCLVSAMIIASLFGCRPDSATDNVTGTTPLAAAAWNNSKWISVKNAPVVKGRNQERAADGANWFVSNIKNEKKVASA